MAGTYGDLALSNAAEGAFGVDVIGVGTVSIGDLSSPNFTNPINSNFKNFTCSNKFCGHFATFLAHGRREVVQN